MKCLEAGECPACSLPEAVQILDNAVRQSYGNAQLVNRKSLPDREYLEYEVPGLFGKDFME